MKPRFPLALPLAMGAALVASALPAAAGGVEMQGGEFPLTLRNPGDQMNPSLALGPSGGLLVWQDAAVDGQGLGIAALRLNATLSPEAGGSFRVNQNPAGDQENARVALLANGGAFVVWQGGPLGFQRVHARVLAADGTFLTGDLLVSSGGGEHELEPAVTLTADGDVLVTWAAYRQEGAYYNVFARRFSPAGEPRGDAFRVNEQTGLSRRSAAIAPRADGGFLAAWIGERVVGERNNLDSFGRRVPGAGAPIFEVAVYTRAFGADGAPLTGDQKVAGTEAPAAHPALLRLPDGRFVLAWTQRHPLMRAEGLDVACRVLSPTGAATGADFRLNTYTYGDQYRPRLVSAGSGVLVVWSSMGQDGSWEGVYGRWLNETGAPVANEEFRINSTTGGGQVLPAVAAADGSRILVAWSSNLPQVGMEVFGQRLAAADVLQPLSAPQVVALSPSSVMVSWPAVTGLAVDAYRIYAAGGGQLAEVAENFWTLENLAPASKVQVEVAYVLDTGEVSPRSPSASGQSWGADRNFDGLPDDWQERWWPGEARFPAAWVDSDGDGVNNLNEWLSGTNPTDAASCLKVGASKSPLGLRLEWATQQGFVYQLQSSTDGREWQPVGGPRFAADTSDAMTLPASGSVTLYRVLRVR